MGSIVPNVKIVESWHDILIAELNVTKCKVTFTHEMPDDKFLLGVYNPCTKEITIHLHRSLVGRRMTANKKKKIEMRIAETLLHEYRHHWQYTHARELVKASIGVEYYKRPIELDAREFAKRKTYRFSKLIAISKGGEPK